MSLKYVIQARTPKGIFMVGDYLEEDTEMILACGLHEMEHVLTYDDSEQAQNLIKRIAKDLDSPADAFDSKVVSEHPMWVEEIDDTPLVSGRIHLKLRR